MNITAFLSYVVITSITPGPSNLLIMNETRLFGFRRAWKFNGGILMGFALLGILSALFTSYLHALLPTLQPILKLFGAIYLLYLAYKTGFPKASQDQNITVQATFLSGLFFQIINMKSILFFLTALTTFILPYSTSLIYNIQYTFYAIVLGWSALLLWAAFGSLFKLFFVKYDKLFRWTMSLLLLYSAFTIYL